MKFLTAILAVFLAGCASLPLRPGRSEFSSGDTHGSVRQSQNPQAETFQKYEKISEPVYGRTFTPVEVQQIPAVHGTVNTPVFVNNTPVRTTERIETRIGAAQKDTAREIGAKLSSLSGVVWVGVLLFLFGAVSLFYPPLKLIINSTTTSIVITAAGLALIVLPVLIVGHEVLILAVGAGAVVIYWFAHRYGRLRGFVDANHDGLDDRTGKPN